MKPQMHTDRQTRGSEAAAEKECVIARCAAHSSRSVLAARPIGEHPWFHLAALA
jgi:hypothetical protein